MLPERILLIGGGGFIGQALAQRLLALGVEVHLALRHPASDGLLRQATHVVDTADPVAWRALLEDFPAVVHLASATTPGTSARQPTLEAANLVPFLAFLEAMGESPQIRLLHFSSGGTLYGNPAKLPVSEDAPLSPLSSHGAVKAAQEMLLSSLRAQGRPAVSLRPSNAYGPGQALKPGFGLVRTLFERLKRNEPIDVYGDGEAVRDYVFIDDVVNAALLCLEMPRLDGAFNLGSGAGTSINALIDLAAGTSGRTPQIRRHPSRPGDVASIVLDASRFRSLGWTPQVGLEAGLKETWEWMKSH